MADPIVSWFNREGTQQVTSWSVGTVDAGQASMDFGVTIWNNKGGTSNVSDMQECKFTTKDSAGGDGTGSPPNPLVRDKWVRVRVDSLKETGFSQVGGATTWPIAAETAPSGRILGTANNGIKADSLGNFAELTLRAVVPSAASAGTIQFLNRVSYYFT